MLSQESVMNGHLSMVSQPDMGHLSTLTLIDQVKGSFQTKLPKNDGLQIFFLREISLTHLKIIKQLTIKPATAKTRDWF